jgi:hypothetical protein
VSPVSPCPAVYACVHSCARHGAAVAKLAKKGLTPSQIGVVLRDSHGITSVKAVTGQKILRVLKQSCE